MLPGNIQDIFGSLVVGIFFFLISIIIYHTVKSIFKSNHNKGKNSFHKWLKENILPIKTFSGLVLFIIFYSVGVLIEDITDSVTEDTERYQNSILFDYPRDLLGEEYKNRLQAILDENGDISTLGKEIINNDSLINILAKKSNTTAFYYRLKYIKIYYLFKNKSNLEYFINDVYFLSKNWAYKQSTYFNELELIQNRINLGQGLFYLSYWFSLMVLLILLILPRINYTFERTIFIWNLRYQGIKLFGLLIFLITIAMISRITYKNSEKLHSQRAIGYFSTYLRLSERNDDNGTIIIEQKSQDGEIRNYAIIKKEGTLECFKRVNDYLSCESSTDSLPINCEISAVTYYNQKLVLGSDKNFPDHAISQSPIFEIAYPINSTIQKSFMENQEIFNAQKFEDFTISPDQEFVFAITAFDRGEINIDKNYIKDFDRFNNLIYWKVGEAEKAKIIHDTTRFGIRSSVSMRRRILKALNNSTVDLPVININHFKIEGLAYYSSNRLLLGIREIGVHFTKAVSTFLILSAELSDDFKIKGIKVFYFKPQSQLAGITTPLGISGLEYDPKTKNLYVLTSYEPRGVVEKCDEDIGAYFWVLTQNSLVNNGSPLIIRNPDQTPLHFAHKAEGISLIDNNTFFIVHDDDQITGRNLVTDPENQFKRYHNQAAYSIVELQ